MQRSYFFHEEKEHTFQFTYAGDFTGIPESFLNQRPSKFYLETLQKSILLRLSHTQFSKLCITFPDIANWRMKAVEEQFDLMVQRQIEIQVFSAEERFKRFMQRSSNVFQLIPQKYIASYLNMRPETFSKMLGKVKISGK